jgi:hypothetical protein
VNVVAAVTIEIVVVLFCAIKVCSVFWLVVKLLVKPLLFLASESRFIRLHNSLLVVEHWGLHSVFEVFLVPIFVLMLLVATLLLRLPLAGRF